ncbi:MAG: hypothetical protein WC201_02190 [Bacilli bacterium]
MAIFKKKETLTGNITYMALMAAINVVFVLLATWLPYLLFLLVFILPLTSTIVTLFCNKKYFIIYTIVTIGLCLLATIWDIGNTLFYVVPSIFSGFAFGILLEKRTSPILIILAAVFTQIIFSYLALPIINILYGRDIVSDFATFFKLDHYAYLNYVKHMFICSLALIQQILSFIVINEELPKMNIDTTNFKKGETITLFLIPLFIGTSVALVFFYPELSYSVMFMVLLLSIYELGILIVNRNKLIIALLISSAFLSVFLFAGFYSLISQATSEPIGLLLLQIFPLFIAVIGFINNYLFKNKKQDTIGDRQN